MGYTPDEAAQKAIEAAALAAVDRIAIDEHAWERGHLARAPRWKNYLIKEETQ